MTQMTTTMIDQRNHKAKLHVRNNIDNLTDLSNLLTYTFRRAALLNDAFSVIRISDFSDEFYDGAELVIRDIYRDLKAACDALDEMRSKNKV